MMLNKKLIRIQLDMPEERVRELELIMAKTGVSTRKDIFENAIALFEWAVNERSNGRIIASLNEKENSFRELLMPALASVKNEAKNKNSSKKGKIDT